MAALELALVLIATVLASAILDQLLPRISLPLIQIACGIVVALIAQERITITLNPELFLVLFIAPLLFHEATEANKTALWKSRGRMLSYAIGLVVAIVLAVGFSVHAIIPSIPLAAAFALGAALGPTDPIAVASISSQADIPERQKTTLQGESLLNDASGIVSFQFAVAAVVTGSFSALEAITEFAIEFFGALLVGVVFGYALVKFADKVRDLGLENTTFHVALELLTPLVAYLLGEIVGVSGIILVVACGITVSLIPRDFGPAMSRMSIVSKSVWEVITFALNGVVFVMLGTQLPQSFGDLWVDQGIRNLDLIIAIVAITAVMHTTRFIWTIVCEALADRKGSETRSLAERARSAAVMTLAGSKGAITLAIMCSLPLYITVDGTVQGFPQRDLLIFLACGVILLSLLLATFVVPLLAPRATESAADIDHDYEEAANVLRGVVEGLTARQTKENRKAYSQVIARYNDRINRLKEKHDLTDESDLELRLKVLDWEQEYVLDLIEADEVPPLEGYQYVSRVAHIESMLKRGKNRSVAVSRWMRRTRTLIRKHWNKLRGKDCAQDPQSSSHIMRQIQARAEIHVIERLKEELPESDLQSETISQLINEYENNVFMLRGPAPSITALTRNAELDLDATRMGLRLELEQIQLAYEEGRISRAAAQKMRENVYLMQVDVEDYV